jgi:DNA-binding HxlR family transcriptional regulator
MATPRPGRPVRGSRTGRPIMALLDLLGRRWILRVLWELRAEALGFRALQARCDGMSPSVLAQRLTDLGDAGIVEGSEVGYRLTAAGQALLQALTPLRDWAAAWGVRPIGAPASPGSRAPRARRRAARAPAPRRTGG